MFLRYISILREKKNGIRRNNKLKIIGLLLLVGGPYLLLYYHLSEKATGVFYINDQDFSERLEYFRPVNFSQVAPSSDRRVIQLRQTCQALRLDGEPIRANVMHHILVDDRHKTLFCGVPTSAWTSWVTFLVNVSADTAEPSPPYGHHLPVHSRNYLRNKHIRPLVDYFPDEIRHRLDTYFSFMVVRHPLKRPVSSYNNRLDINHVEANLHWAVISKQIKEQYRQKSLDPGQTSSKVQQQEARKKPRQQQHSKKQQQPPPQEQPPPQQQQKEQRQQQEQQQQQQQQPQQQQAINQDNVTFSEYVRYVLDHFPQDRHWVPYIHACQACSIRYDYIVKLESMQLDSQDVFERMAIPADRRYLPHLKGLVSAGINTGQVFVKYLRSLPREVYQRLLSTYITDMKLFNYGEPQPLQVDW